MSPRSETTCLGRIGLLSLALMAALPAAQAQDQPAGPSAAEQELARRLDRLASELAEVKAQLAALQARPAVAAASPPAAAPMTVAAPSASEPATVLGSYGELNYNRPTRHGEQTRADLRRFVLGLQHRFDERTKVVAEVEVEHGVSSASDPGEVAIEQAYVERQLNAEWSVRGGLFLMPLGLLNENHEPPSFYGVERNAVETAIIPSTWREGGVQLVGNLDGGWTLQAGVSTSFDLNKWDATAAEGRESPLGSVHQEMALAKARDLALFGAVNWRGVPGLQLGAGLFSGGATHGLAVADARVTLWDVHARWTPGRWDLSALYSRGTISNTAALNRPLVGNITLIPSSFDGGYLQAAYRLWSRQDSSVSPFLRWERLHTARSFADLGPGLTPDPAMAERVWTAGANWQLTPGVVVKADVQRFDRDRDNDRLNLGIGWSF